MILEILWTLLLIGWALLIWVGYDRFFIDRYSANLLMRLTL